MNTSRCAVQCTHCARHHYLFAGTIFQDCKLEQYKLILGLYLFFTSNKGISAIELANNLNVNYKTALLLARKCRILMAKSNAEKILDSLFYEADTAYIGAKSKASHSQGCGTDKQPCLFILGTNKEHNYPNYMKLHVMNVDSSDNIERIFNKSIRLGKDRILNTDGKTTFAPLSERITLVSEKITDYTSSKRLHWINIIIGNFQNHINGIYHGVSKRDLPLFLNEQQFRFNHRNTGKAFIDKVMKYITLSSPITRKQITYTLDLALPFFS